LTRILGGSAGLLDQLGDTVNPLGRVPRSQVLEALQEAHFTVLLRPDRRYSNAGFPSKVPESLAAGVPILLNLTSDLREYLGDGTAALLVDDSSPMEVTRAIRRALQLTPEELSDFRRCARAKAEKYFDYRVYVDSFKAYLEQVI
jgi:glycosyltransferase involved in cell wall biosynthesis